MHVITGMGKRSALLDVSRDRGVFERLVASADVVVTGYRPGALDRYGLTPEALVEIRPGLVVASLSAWGPTGPWGGRRGFDSIVQAASGIAMVESADGETPGALPAQALDYATGFLLAAAILHAISRQVAAGGSFHAQAHLARTAVWLLDHPDPQPRNLPDVTDLLRESSTPLGLVHRPTPPIQFAGAPTDWPPLAAWGASPCEWLAE
jgi:crotonobetainyl-CoA:carnitine CoA-transferase CaiB-like acyl-CoA transferase